MPTPPNSGPYFTEDDRPYYIVNGHPVWGTSGQRNPASSSSSREIAHSVNSKFQSRDKRPEPKTTQSYPPVTRPSDMRTRMTTGYPKTRYSAGASQGSAPASGHQTRDPYRSAMDPSKSQAGPPLQSPFSQQYNDYKDFEWAAEPVEEQYKDYLKSAPRVSRKMRDRNPGVYAGEPPQTKEWHQKAAQYAERARDQYDR